MKASDDFFILFFSGLTRGRPSLDRGAHSPPNELKMASVAPTSKDLGFILSKLPSVEKKRIKKVHRRKERAEKRNRRAIRERRRRSSCRRRFNPPLTSSTLLSSQKKKKARPHPGPRAQAPLLHALSPANLGPAPLRLCQGSCPLRRPAPAAGPGSLVGARAGAARALSLPPRQGETEQQQQQQRQRQRQQGRRQQRLPPRPRLRPRGLAALRSVVALPGGALLGGARDRHALGPAVPLSPRARGRGRGGALRWRRL